MDLEPERIIALRSWAANNNTIREFWLFGSRAKDTAKPDSDFDLAIYLMPETDNTNWTFAKFVEYQGLWKKQLERIVARPISLCVIEPGEELFDEVMTTGTCLWSRFEMPSVRQAPPPS
jgi:predicted nucleotidyltransferase